MDACVRLVSFSSRLEQWSQVLRRSGGCYLSGPRVAKWYIDQMITCLMGRWIDENSVLEGLGAAGSTKTVFWRALGAGGSTEIVFWRCARAPWRRPRASRSDPERRPGASQRRSRASCCAPETSQSVLERPRASPERSQDVLDRQK